MRTKEKIIFLLVGVTLVLGALVFFSFQNNELDANYFRWLIANKLDSASSSPLQFLSDELPAGTFFYGGLGIFAVVMTIVVLKMVRDGEIQALRRRLTDLSSEKHATESLLQEQVWKGKHEQQAKDSVRRDLEASIDKIELLLSDLNEKERELKTRDSELMALKSSASVDSTAVFSRTPIERRLREEINKQKDILQAKDAAVRDLEQRLNAQNRLWENQLREKDGILKERENELESSRAELSDLNSRLNQLEGAKKRAEGVLQEELRKKKDVLEAEALARKAEEKRLGENIRNLETQLGERDKALRHRESEMNGIRRQLKELEAAKAQAESRFQEALAEAERDSHAKHRLLRETEQRLGAGLQSLKTEVSEKELLLQVRDEEVKSLKSEVKAVSLRLSEVADGRARAEQTLQEELKREKQQHDAAKLAYQELASRYDGEIKLLKTQLNEREALSKRRDGEIRALEQKLQAVSQSLRAAEEGKAQAERSLREELKKEQIQRASSETAKRELEQRYDKEVHTLKDLLSEAQESRKSRDQEIKSLKAQVASLADQLAKVGSAKERAASLLQQTIKKEKEVLQANDSAVREIEEAFKARIATLEEQLQAKQEVVGSRESEAAELKSELLSLQQRMSDLAAAKARTESLFEEAVKERTEQLQSKDAGIKKLEEDLSGKIRRLENQLREREEQLDSRESELNALKNRVDELTTAKEQVAHELQDDLRRKADLLGEKEAAISAVEEGFGRRIRSLESELREKQELLGAREVELRTLLSKVTDQAGRLTELENSRGQAARLIEDELRQTTELLQSKEAAMKAVEERLTERLRSVESQLGQKQELLESRDADVDLLMSKVNELTQKLNETGAERERSERLTQEELREKAALLQSREASISELEERLGGRVESLERQIADKQRLLETSGTELSELRADMNALAERLNEAESAKVKLQDLLQQERNKEDKALIAMSAFEAQASERVNGEANGLETLLSEREQLLQARDKLIQNLMTELKEKKTQLARQEIEVWKNIERREAWKHRLSKFGIRLKD
jgi:chromosome segregation ATPase